jgi:hypothetical protein
VAKQVFDDSRDRVQAAALTQADHPRGRLYPPSTANSLTQSRPASGQEMALPQMWTADCQMWLAEETGSLQMCVLEKFLRPGRHAGTLRRTRRHSGRSSQSQELHAPHPLTEEVV